MQNVEKFPKLCRQCKGGLEYAFITDGTRRVYLKDGNGNPALYGTPQAREAYHRLLAEKAASQAAPPKSDTITVNYLVAEFFKIKVPTIHPAHHHHFRVACRELLALYSGYSVAEISPLKIEAVRERFIENRWSRNYCNEQTGRIRQIFRWGIGREFVPAFIVEALKCVEPLRKGKTTAPESKPRHAIPAGDIEKTIAELTPTIAAMVRVHLAIAARPAEICKMRIEQINRTNADCWEVRYTEHKTAAKTGDKTLYLAKSEIAIIEPLIGDRQEGYLFRPADVIDERKVERWKNAKHKKKTPSRVKRDKTRAEKRKKPKNEFYDVAAYRKFITRACDRAGVPRWFPYGLRHTGVTEIGKKFGIEAAQHVAGHRELRTTMNYFHGQDTIAKSVALARNAEMEKAQAPSVKPVTAPSVPDNADVVQMLKQQNVMLLALLQKQGIVSLESQTETI